MAFTSILLNNFMNNFEFGEENILMTSQKSIQGGIRSIFSTKNSNCIGFRFYTFLFPWGDNRGFLLC